MRNDTISYSHQPQQYCLRQFRFLPDGFAGKTGVFSDYKPPVDGLDFLRGCGEKSHICREIRTRLPNITNNPVSGSTATDESGISCSLILALLMLCVGRSAPFLEHIRGRYGI
jgi:hypothetical protein